MAVKFESAVIDGQPVVRRVGMVSSSLYDQQTTLLLSRLLKDAGADITSGNMKAWTFTDTDGVSITSGEITGGVLKNTQAEGTAATSAGSLLPVFASADNDGDGHSYTTSDGYNIASTDAGYTSLYGGFNGVTDSTSSGNYYLGWESSSGSITILFPSTQTISGYKGYTYVSGSYYPTRGWGTWTAYGTTDGGETWFEIESRTGFSSWPSSASGYEFTFSSNQTINGIRFDVDSNAGGSGTYLTELQIIGAGTSATEGAANQLEAIIDPVKFDTAQDYGRFILVAQNTDIEDGEVTLAAADSDLTVYYNEDGSTNYSSALTLESAEALGNDTNLWQLVCNEIAFAAGTQASFRIISNADSEGVFPNLEVTGFAMLPRVDENDS